MPCSAAVPRMYAHDMGSAIDAVYAERDRLLASNADELEHARGSADPRMRAIRIEHCHQHAELINRVAELVATWEPLPEPEPVPVEVVEGWREILTLPFERTEGWWERDRRFRAVKVGADNKPVKQSTEVAADRLFALVTHRANVWNDGYSSSLDNHEIRREYVKLFGDKDIGKLSPKNVAAKIPSFVEATTDLFSGDIYKRVKNDVFSCIELPKGAHKEIAAIISRIVSLSDAEYFVACKLAAAKVRAR